MPPPASDILTISVLTTRIKELVEEAFPALWVSGEISNFTKASSGHMYFNLKDAGATIGCTFFRGSNLRLKFSPRDGFKSVDPQSISDGLWLQDRLWLATSHGLCVVTLRDGLLPRPRPVRTESLP